MAFRVAANGARSIWRCDLRRKSAEREFTPSREGDSLVPPDLLDQIPEGEDIGTVTADGAYDTRRCHGAVIARGGTAIIPIRRKGRAWKEDCPAAKARGEILRATRHRGGSRNLNSRDKWIFRATAA